VVLRLLLDTNAFLWMQADSPRLTQRQRTAMVNADRLLVSTASAWELAILVRLKRIALDASIGETIRDSGLELLEIRLDHIEQLAGLPLLHRDPFDRMLVAQAMVEDCNVVTSDRRFAQYGVSVIGADG
jgi:PIN domain nuclease of toxin-antitoxin system